jgi:rhamnosyltransferase
MPRISVVVPCNNERTKIGACLEGILSQSLADQLEIIVIDSGSTDGTLDILAKYPIALRRILPHEFNHGATRNLGVQTAGGQFVALTVADARPADKLWLERMLRHFDDPKVAAVCGQQVVPHEPDKNPLQWFRPQSEPAPKKVHFSTAVAFEGLPAADQLACCCLDNVTAMYRRSVLLDIPFPKVDCAEDMVWAREALRQGHSLVYDYSARVYHYHNETFRSRFKRTYTFQYHAHKNFGCRLPTPPLLSSLARSLYWGAQRRYCPSRRFQWTIYNSKILTAEALATACLGLVANAAGGKGATRTHDWLCGRNGEGVAWSFRAGR